MVKAGKKAVVDEPLKGITKISVKGFKSLAKETSIEIKPLTILAGANNSGKSSIMQPLLMMKQTMEEASEPVSDIDIDGDHVSYNTPDEFLSNINGRRTNRFTIEVNLNTNMSIRNVFKSSKTKLINLTETAYKGNNSNLNVVVRTNTDINELARTNPAYNIFLKSFYDGFDQMKKEDFKDTKDELNLNDLGIGLCVRRKRCLLSMAIDNLDPAKELMMEPVFIPVAQEHQQIFEKYILDIIHVPADRGNPQRSYKATGVGRRFKGPINNYVASILYEWKLKKAPELKILEKWLQALEITGGVEADHSSDNRLRILVHRLPQNRNKGADDLVNIADVGFGTSQVLPVLVAMLAANKDQLVFIEQPEVHLHPKAQYKLAYCIAETAKRGVHVIVETHSEMLLISLQTIVASKRLSPENVVLHWFERTKDGRTKVRSGTLDKNGAYGEWPVDFADISYEANRDYLRATGFMIGK